jgi:hypothetical protein
MLGFAWLTLRQAQEALKNGRLDEAYRLLCQSEVQGHKRSFELLQQVAQGFVKRGQHHLENNDPSSAWNDLIAAEQAGAREGEAAQLRQALIRHEIAEIRLLLDAGEPARAVEVAEQLQQRGARPPELTPLEEAAKAWKLAREQASRGEFGQALQTMHRVGRLTPGRCAGLDQFVRELEQKHQAFASLLPSLHEAVEQRRWGEVVQWSERVLAMAPMHEEVRRMRNRAWKAIEPATVPATPAAVVVPVEETPRQRFLLWIDGIGGFLVCLENKVTIGQATADAYVDIPLFADVSRLHATMTRDSEGYLIEAARALQINGRPTERALLRAGDRITLGSSCQIQFRMPVPVSASARLDIVSGHRLPLAVDGVLLMADTLVLGPGSQVHVAMPDLKQPIVLFRQKDGLGIRHVGEFHVDGERQKDRATLGSASTVTGEDFGLAIEALGSRMGRA